MDTLFRLFHDHQLAAGLAGVFLLIITILPFSRGGSRRAFRRLGSTLASVVIVPFSFWKRTVVDLASGPGGSPRRGATGLARKAVPILQSVLIVGGLLILTAGFVSGWQASGITRETGYLKSALRSELPDLERTLADTRSRIAVLDSQWTASRSCFVDESLSPLFSEAGEIRDENAELEAFLSNDRRTKEVFRLLREDPTPARTGDDDASRNLRTGLPALGLPPDKEWFLARYLDNRAREEELMFVIRGFDEGAVRNAHQPDIETLHRIVAEIPPAIAQIRSDLEAPDPDRTFDGFAFAAAFFPAVIVFCGFIWVVGGLIEMAGSGVPLVTGTRASVNDEGHLKWAE
jgi:hypothetical protein